RAHSSAAPIANREPQKSTGGGRKCSQLFPVEHEGGAGRAGSEFDNADDGLLDQLTLILQVFSQDLGQLGPCLGLRPRELRHGWHGDCDPGEKEEFAPDNLHDSLLNQTFVRALCGVNPASESKFTDVAITKRCFGARDLTDL